MKSSILFLAATLTLSAQTVKLPPFAKSTLPNGATLILLERPELPLVSIGIAVRGGSEANPPGLAGLANLTGDLMSRGTATRSSEQIAQTLDSLGASLRYFESSQTLNFGVECLDKDTDAALDVLADVLRNPSFPEAEVKKRLAQALDGVRARKDNPQAALGQYFSAFFYGAKHPYAQPDGGDEASLAKINREAIVAFHQRLVVGKNLIIVAGGRFNSAAMKAKLEKAFGAIPAGVAYEWAKDPGLPRSTAPRLLLIDKPDATQTYFTIGQPGIRKGHPDEAALSLVNTLFGGRFTSMLNEELRINSGLTYGAGSRPTLDRMTGALTISSFTKTETTERALDITLDLLKKLNTQGLNEAQLKSAKAYTKGLFPTNRLETTDQILGILSDIEIYGLNRGEIDDLFSRLDAVNVERANAIAKQYYRSEGLVFVLLGNAAKIRDVVKKYAPGNVTEIPITQPGFSIR